MNVYPFTVFKRVNRPFYFVSYKDANGKCLSPVSTKKRTEKEAMQVAFAWLRDGVPKKNATLKVLDLSIRDFAKKIKTESDAEALLTELKRSGLVKNFVLNDTPQAEDFISFLTTFWMWEKSSYIKEKLRKSQGIHKDHCIKQGQAIMLHWKPFFEGRCLGDITTVDIDAFINHMGEKDLSASRKNVIIKAGLKPLRWAFSKGIIEKDPTRGHIMFSGEASERHILTPSTAAAIFRTEWKDSRVKLANMLTSVTGMRSGEVLALRFQDLGRDCLYVRSSWNNADKIKSTKNNKTRTVEIPFPSLMSELFEQAKQNPWGVTPNSFVFWSVSNAKRPMQPDLFVDGLRDSLRQIGFSDEEAKQYVFHGWRHFYTSYMVRRLDKKLLKFQTGHLTDEMIAHYADHETEGDRELIQAQEREAFAGLLPEPSNMFVCKHDNDYQMAFAE